MIKKDLLAVKPFTHGAIAASLAVVLTGCGLTFSAESTNPAPPTQSTSASVVAPIMQPTNIPVVVAATAALPSPSQAASQAAAATSTDVPVPTTEPVPVSQKPTIGSLYILDEYGTEQAKRVPTGAEVQLYVGQIHNAQHVTFYIQRGENLPTEVLGEADVIVPGMSNEGGASLFWKVDTTGPIVWLSAQVDNNAGQSTNTAVYPLTIDAAPVPSAPQAEPLRYLWPSSPPQQMQIDPLESTAGEGIFVINLSAPGTQWSAQVTGGHTSRAAQLPTSGTEAVTVRGQQGSAFSTGGGYNLFWQEGGQPYAVLSSLSLDDALALANGLQSLDQAAWLANLGQVIEASVPAQPTPTDVTSTEASDALAYFWPTTFPGSVRSEF